MKLFFSLIILITVLCTKLWSDSIVITTGNKIYYGEIIEENNSEIKLQTNDQTVIKIPKDNISSINPLLYKIVTISGATHIGSIVKENDSVLHLRNEEGIEFEIPKSQIEAKMIAEKHAKLANYQSHNDDYKPLQRTSYIPKEFGMIGLTLGTPGTVNLYLGYQTDFVGLSLEGGYYGLELNLGLRLHTTENSFINANALLGRSDMLNKNANYSGLKLTYSYKSIFIQSGMAFTTEFVSYYYVGSIGLYLQI